MNQSYYLPHTKLQSLLDAIIERGYRCVGPQTRGGTITYDDFSQVKELPWGYEDEQLPGQYTLKKTQKTGYFNWVNGPQAIKPELFKPKESLWNVTRDEEGKLSFQPAQLTPAPLCLFGVRPCDIAAMQIQDKVFITGTYRDERYAQRRENTLIIAANCITSSNNCFCVGAGGFPKAERGYDIALTEIEDGFTLEFGSEQGSDIIASLKLSEADGSQINYAKQRIQEAADKQTKTLPGTNLRDALMNNLDHPRWDAVAERCLSCGNCTQVCPTCFCHSEEDEPNVKGNHSEHVREWDSCFTQGHSYIHGKVIRSQTRQRYRQWLTHKLGTWHDQFGESGCVGCGRCVSWCPVGIDITEEATAICSDFINLENKENSHG